MADSKKPKVPKAPKAPLLPELTSSEKESSVKYVEELTSPSGLPRPEFSSSPLPSVKSDAVNVDAQMEALIRQLMPSIVTGLVPILDARMDALASRLQASQKTAAVQLADSQQVLIQQSLETERRERAQEEEKANDRVRQRQLREADEERLSLEAMVEQARVNAVLPPRELVQDSDKRLRGGVERLAPRSQALARLCAAKGISADTEQALLVLLAQGSQVPPPPPLPSPPPLSLLGVAGTGVEDRSASSLFAHLQMEGLAPATAGGEALLAIQKVFKAAGEQESKKAATVASYSEFVEFLRKTKVLSRVAFEKDPDSFWQMLWHSQSVQHLYCNWGWETAGDYHKSVMKSWQEGFMDLPSMVETEECRRGDVAGALHQRFFSTALQATGAKPKVAEKSKNKRNTIYCTFCKKKGNHTALACHKRQEAGAPVKP
jgi:hypothetical protein